MSVIVSDQSWLIVAAWRCISWSTQLLCEDLADSRNYPRQTFPQSTSFRYLQLSATLLRWNDAIAWLFIESRGETEKLRFYRLADRQKQNTSADCTAFAFRACFGREISCRYQTDPVIMTRRPTVIHHTDKFPSDRDASLFSSSLACRFSLCLCSCVSFSEDSADDSVRLRSRLSR